MFLTRFLGIHRRQKYVVIALDFVLLAEHRGSPKGATAPFASVKALVCLDAMVGLGLGGKMPACVLREFVCDMLSSLSEISRK
jgi:hypothetical protein|tara:strand:+ start:1999 stop:2247 length:249 start_codon:yes stop_codon:yes gene_type:complete